MFFSFCSLFTNNDSTVDRHCYDTLLSMQSEPCITTVPTMGGVRSEQEGVGKKHETR